MITKFSKYKIKFSDAELSTNSYLKTIVNDKSSSDKTVSLDEIIEPVYKYIPIVTDDSNTSVIDNSIWGEFPRQYDAFSIDTTHYDSNEASDANCVGSKLCAGSSADASVLALYADNFLLEFKSEGVVLPYSSMFKKDSDCTSSCSTSQFTLKGCALSPFSIHYISSNENIQMNGKIQINAPFFSKQLTDNDLIDGVLEDVSMSITRESDKFVVVKTGSETPINIQASEFPGGNLPYILGVVVTGRGGPGSNHGREAVTFSMKKNNPDDVLGEDYDTEYYCQYSGAGGSGGACCVAILDFLQYDKFVIKNTVNSAIVNLYTPANTSISGYKKTTNNNYELVALVTVPDGNKPSDSLLISSSSISLKSDCIDHHVNLPKTVSIPYGVGGAETGLPTSSKVEGTSYTSTLSIPIIQSRKGAKGADSSYRFIPKDSQGNTPINESIVNSSEDCTHVSNLRINDLIANKSASIITDNYTKVASSTDRLIGGSGGASLGGISASTSNTWYGISHFGAGGCGGTYDLNTYNASDSGHIGGAPTVIIFY